MSEADAVSLAVKRTISRWCFIKGGLLGVRARVVPVHPYRGTVAAEAKRERREKGQHSIASPTLEWPRGSTMARDLPVCKETTIGLVQCTHCLEEVQSCVYLAEYMDIQVRRAARAPEILGGDPMQGDRYKP